MLIKTLAVMSGGALAWALASSCSDSRACSGAETCGCYPNGTCDEGLACKSNTCVNLNATGPAGGAGGSSGGGGGVDVQACLACGESNCSTEATACKASSGCNEIIECMVGCNKDATCLAQCNKGASTDANQKSLTYQTCAFSRCLSDCVYSGTGAGGSSGSGSGGSSTGKGGNATSGVGGASGAGGSGIVDPTTGTNWLTLSADAAPSDLGVNGKLGINGVFYAYGDGCSTISWDAVTRCMSGELCLASAVNWGVGIGFDFANTGMTGMPPDTKYPWSATKAGATGLAWQTRGNPGQPLQVWVLNMDPKWAGACAAAECGINGPPDGVPAASQSSQLSFATMTKDNWGGTGVVYAFNPANISSLQFKIPAATDSLSTSYRLCIDRLGIVR